MDAVDRPLTYLHEATDLFVVAKELRVLHAVTNAGLRLQALETIARFEHHAANLSPWFVLEAAVDAKDPGWAARIDELRAQWNAHAVDGASPRFPMLDAVSEAAAPPRPVERVSPGPDSPSLGFAEPVPLRGTSPAENTAAAFVLELKNCASLLPAPLEELVIVLAPVQVAERERWSAELAAMAGAIERVRFVIVDLEEPVAASVVTRLRDRSISVDARIDPVALREELRARVQAMRQHFGAGDFRVHGFAAPDVAPPARRGRNGGNAAVRAALRSKGLDESEAPDGEIPAAELRALEASVAFQDGQVAEAVRLELEARDYLDQAKRPREAGRFELLAGTYALQGSLYPEAERIFLAVGDRASAHDDPALGLHARIALGGLYMLLQRAEHAAAIYADAAPLAKRAGSAELEVEAWRLSGQAFATIARTDDAARAWVQAIRAATEAGPDVAPRTSASAVARDLADIYESHGLRDRAAALRAQADALAGKESAS